MRTRKLGRSELEVSVIAFGAYPVTGWAWDRCDREGAARTLEAAFEAGMRAVDTAPVYSFGLSEELVGRALHGREDVLVMTKVGLNWQEEHGPHAFDGRTPSGQLVRVRRNGRPASVRREVEDSLRRLARERIDLIQVHAHDPSTPIAETMGALAELRARGLVREIGVSNYTLAQLGEAERALAPVPLVSVQSPYSLLDRGIEADVLPHAQSSQLAVLAYSPLDQGLLSGSVPPERELPEADSRNKRASFLPENRRRVGALLQECVAPVAARLGLSIAQTVLAWTHAQAGVTCALVGARTPEQARQNAAAGALELSAEDSRSLRSAFERLVLLPRPRPSLVTRLRGRFHQLRKRFE